MCGIALHFRSAGPVAPLPLHKLHHRGPDASGEWVSPAGNCWFGHTRLAILDLSPTGAQPMRDSRSGNVIIFNGEIYNHRELRAQLADIHPVWQGTSDTETLLVAYTHWGEAVLPRLKGMFAFAIYDAGDQSLFLARDRLGIKPLYYEQHGESFIAASETRALRNGSSHSTRESLSSFLRWGASPEQELIFPNLKVFPAGHSLRLTNNGDLNFQNFWPHSGRAANVANGQAEDAARGVRRRLETAVEEHLQADVPVAVFLSGGIDSSIITALAAQKLNRPLQTFSVGFANGDFDETSIAEEVAARYGAHFERIRLSEAEAVTAVCEAIERLDLPSVDAINTYIVAKQVAGRGIKVALSGLGGDELFGGYPSFQDVPKLKWLARLPAGVLRQFALLGPRGERLADLPPGGDASELAGWRRRFWTDQMIESAGLPGGTRPFAASTEWRDDFARISWVELTGYMRHLLLRDADQMSMAVSLELRVPFLDHELVDFVLGLPEHEKRRHRYTKGLLVHACQDLLPKSVYARKKMGFGLPMRAWMQGPLRAYVREGLDRATALAILSEPFTERMEKQFNIGRLHWTRLWSIVVLGHYLHKATVH